MAQPNVIFKGIPRQGIRAYTAETVRQVQPDVVVIPCVGAYAIAAAVAGAGVQPHRIYAGDITLYSSVIGAYLANRPFDLEPIGRWEWLGQYMSDPTGQVAAVMLALRILQSGSGNAFARQHSAELEKRADVYVAQLRAKAEQLKSLLEGIQYEPRDLRELIAEHIDNPKALLLVDPPRYTGGYDNMFRGLDEAFRWAAPSVPQFTEADYKPLLAWLGAGAALSLVFYMTPMKTSERPDETFGAPWQSVFANRPKEGASASVDWILANRPLPTHLVRADFEKGVRRPPYPLFTQGEIRPDSVLAAVPEKAEIVGYYRDLMVHNLGATAADRYYLFLVDGQVAGVCGFHTAAYRGSGKPGEISLIFSFTVENARVPRLHKLMLMSVTSSWWWKREVRTLDPPVERIQTTMLTRFPEVKTARGVFDLEQRERRSDGSFRLVYAAPVAVRTVQETLAEWLEEYVDQADRSRRRDGGAPRGAEQHGVRRVESDKPGVGALG